MVLQEGLFIADMSEGGTLTLNDWSLELTAVPEPEQYAVLFGCSLMAWGFYRRRKTCR